VNVRALAPGSTAAADLEKDANGFDLPIALGLLVASGQVAFDRRAIGCRNVLTLWSGNPVSHRPNGAS